MLPALAAPSSRRAMQRRLILRVGCGAERSTHANRRLTRLLARLLLAYMHTGSMAAPPIVRVNSHLVALLQRGLPKPRRCDALLQFHARTRRQSPLPTRAMLSRDAHALTTSAASARPPARSLLASALALLLGLRRLPGRPMAIHRRLLEREPLGFRQLAAVLLLT